MNKKLPKNLSDLSTIFANRYPWQNWSGAVNMLMVQDYFVLIKRSDQMPSHKGQLGFFGGHKQTDEDPIQTALRETSEESGLAIETLEVLGINEPVFTSHKRLIMSVLTRYRGETEEFLRSVTSNGEWSDLILVPTSYLQNNDSWRYAQIFHEQKYKLYFCPLPKDLCLYHPDNAHNEFLLWGASAKMLWNFFKFSSEDDSFLDS